jgi:amino acid transporter
MFNLAAPYVSHWLIVVGHFLLLSSLFASALAFHSLISRYLFTLGREHVLPAGLARTSARSNAPVAASLATSFLSLVIVGVYVVNGWDPLTKLFYQLTVVGGFGVLILMIISSGATAAYFARREHRDGVSIVRGVLAPGLSVLTLGFVLVATLQQFTILLGLGPNDPLRWIFPALFGVAFAAGLGRALHLRGRRPEVYQAIGSSNPPHDADLPPVAMAQGW